MRLNEVYKGVALFLDDERHPPRDGYDWKIVTNFDQAVKYITERGVPNYMSFDHDLGEDSKTGYEFVKWLVEADMDSGGKLIPSDFSYYVHSQNPIGAANIRGYLSSYLDVKRKGEL
jgi:hypothetical protein